ncbi:hypothetical protein B0J11DRAFT_507619 [Dendryphion nanum]|uniref:Uncharacterized protein n=1 Tax=Dendryphion nanum TaxID=256645 RepID=A0A9P9DP04_9PLEO|nr:hypothetical protein B0J11DRAFT_507619 [Dendryphion nanum]
MLNSLSTTAHALWVHALLQAQYIARVAEAVGWYVQQREIGDVVKRAECSPSSLLPWASWACIVKVKDLAVAIQDERIRAQISSAHHQADGLRQKLRTLESTHDILARENFLCQTTPRTLIQNFNFNFDIDIYNINIVNQLQDVENFLQDRNSPFYSIMQDVAAPFPTGVNPLQIENFVHGLNNITGQQANATQAKIAGATLGQSQANTYVDWFFSILFFVSSLFFLYHVFSKLIKLCIWVYKAILAARLVAQSTPEAHKSEVNNQDTRKATPTEADDDDASAEDPIVDIYRLFPCQNNQLDHLSSMQPAKTEASKPRVFKDPNLTPRSPRPYRYSSNPTTPLPLPRKMAPLRAKKSPTKGSSSLGEAVSRFGQDTVLGASKLHPANFEFGKPLEDQLQGEFELED